jgi:hypothetical protein
MGRDDRCRGWKPRGDARQRRKPSGPRVPDLSAPLGMSWAPGTKPVNIAPAASARATRSGGGSRSTLASCSLPRARHRCTSVTSAQQLNEAAEGGTLEDPQYRGRSRRWPLIAIRVGASELLASPVVTERDDKHSEQGTREPKEGRDSDLYGGIAIPVAIVRDRRRAALVA